MQVWDLVQQLQQLAAIPEDSADSQQRVHVKAVHRSVGWRLAGVSMPAAVPVQTQLITFDSMACQETAPHPFRTKPSCPLC